MSNWWIILVIVVLVAAGLFYFRSRRERHEDVVAGAASTRDYAQEREDSRVGQMSEEDRTWEAASLQKNRDTQGQNPPPPVS
jgi:LPXTG-motif cell wall-anchored protein